MSGPCLGSHSRAPDRRPRSGPAYSRVPHDPQRTHKDFFMCRADPPRLFFLAETAADQRIEGRDDGFRILAAGVDRDVGARAGAERHEAEDRFAADGFAAAGDADIGIEFFHGLHEFRRGARVQSLLVADADDADDRALTRCGGLWAIVGETARFSHFPASTRLAIVMYLRPDSCAATTASASGHSPRTLASLTSIGRLMPASTSTLGRLITEMARFDGVPPNMSVRIATPSPLSTRLTASMMSRRHCSPLSSGPILIGSICDGGPTTCSRAARTSTASRPWVTITRPIIETPRGRLGLAAPHERATFMTTRGPMRKGPAAISRPDAALQQHCRKSRPKRAGLSAASLVEIWLIFVPQWGNRPGEADQPARSVVRLAQISPRASASAATGSRGRQIPSISTRRRVAAGSRSPSAAARSTTHPITAAGS